MPENPRPREASLIREAACRCGQLKAFCEGDPLRVSVCHCLHCQRRTGSALGVQTRFQLAKVRVEGAFTTYERIGEGGRRAMYRFCPQCGSTVTFENEAMPGLIGIPLGAFIDPSSIAPTLSLFEARKHRWLRIDGDRIEHYSDAAPIVATAK